MTLESAVPSRRCLVLGVNGQDGSYLAEHLLAAGELVIGVGRQPRSRWVPDQSGFEYVSLDVRDTHALVRLLSERSADVVFHLAAIHGAAGFVYENHWMAVHEVNTLAVHAILEYLRIHRRDGVFIYASSSKVFDVSRPAVFSERTPRRSTCIYSTTKNAATDLIHYYRTRHQIRGGVVWTFNHESVRRAAEYFIPRVVRLLANAILDRKARGNVATLGFWCDWGDASEYMGVVRDLASRAPGDDFVLATGNSIWAADLVEALFARHGLSWREHVIEDVPAVHHRPEPNTVDLSKLRTAIGRVPAKGIMAICDDMLRCNHPEAWRKVRER